MNAQAYCGDLLNKKKLFAGLIVLVIVLALLIWGRDRIHFDFGAFRTQLALANWGKIALGVGCIYVAYIFRSVRWALLLRHHKKVSPLSLLGTQVIGFTAVALIGRVADPVRPYLVAKKTGLPVSQQLAVYIVERMFDFGSMALIFSTVLLTSHEALPHPELLVRIAKSGLLGTAAMAVFTIAVRLSGGVIADFMEKSLHPISATLAHSVGSKIRIFRSGMNTMRSFGDFSSAVVLSLLMWILITFAYLTTTQAFVASPQLASMTIARCMLLMAVSMVASGFQLPILGWFTQIGAQVAAMISFFGVAPEPATACGTTLLIVTFLSIVPVGLVWSQFEHLNLRTIAAESGKNEEEIPV